MNVLMTFLLEQSARHFFVLLAGIAVSAMTLSRILSKRHTHFLWRSAAYAAGGAALGLWNYARYDQEPATQYLTLPILAVAFFTLSMILVVPFVYYRSKSNRAHTDA